MHLECEASLESLHREIILRLGCAIGNLRLIAVGAPFATDLVRLAEQDIDAALTAARDAEDVRVRLLRVITNRPGWGAR